MSDMTDRELLELISTQVANLTTDMSGVKGDISDVKGDISDVKGEISELKGEISELKDESRKTNVKIDHEVMPKINALFDGYKQTSDKLDKIEEEVSKHEEIILRRIK